MSFLCPINSKIVLFLQRGDSLDTIFASSPPPESERNRTKVKSKKRNSPRRRAMEQRGESTDQENSQALLLAESYPQQSYSQAGMTIDDVTGNLTRMSDSVILNIENSSSASSSVSELHIVDDDDDNLEVDDRSDDDDDDDGDENDELQHDNWEIRMLAAELNRRESKRDEQLISSGTNSEADGEESGVMRRRLRKRSDTLESDTEPSEMETRDQTARPRAASLDQHNLRRERAKGVFKALSFDRDKDRL